MEKLSRRQQQIYDIIDGYFKKHGYCPSLADIAQLAGLHESTTAIHVEALKRKGAVKNEYRVARSLRVVEQKPVTDRHSGSGA